MTIDSNRQHADTAGRGGRVRHCMLRPDWRPVAVVVQYLEGTCVSALLAGSAAWWSGHQKSASLTSVRPEGNMKKAHFSMWPASRGTSNEFTHDTCSACLILTVLPR